MHLHRHLLGCLIGLALLAVACGGATAPSETTAPGSSPTPAPTEPAPLPSPTPTTAPEPTPLPSPTTPDAEPTPLPTPEADCTRISDFENGGWRIVNDGVMGGLSEGLATVDDGVLTFAGTIVTDGGGFSLVETGLTEGALAGATSLRFRVRPDERSYELIAEDAQSAPRVSHVGPIVTTGDDWQDVDVPLDQLETRVFGRVVDAPAFRPDLATSIGIILSDGLDGEFSLDVEWVDACR